MLHIYVCFGEHIAQNTANLCIHTQDQTQYRRHTVKEHDHHWDSQQDFNELKNVSNFNISILNILSPSVTHKRQHACNTCEAFPLKCWVTFQYWPSLAEICKNLILLLKTLLHLMEFKPSFIYKKSLLKTSQMNSVYFFTPYLLRFILILFSHLSLGLQNYLFCIHFWPPPHMLHLILLYLITLIFDNQYKFWNMDKPFTVTWL
jgi:hypothetical protein